MRHIELKPLDGIRFSDRYGLWAVIAGASDGTGAAFAEQLAAMGLKLVLIARRENALRALGERLQNEHGTEFRVIVADLTSHDAADLIVQATADIDVGLYISNAGVVGSPADFLDMPIAQSFALIQMNVTNFVTAVHGFGHRFRNRGKGGIIVMASVSALGGQPMHACYSGSKAFQMLFAESLWAELRDQGVDIISIAAPPMDTPTVRRARKDQELNLRYYFVAGEVVHEALARLGTDPTVIFPDFGSRGEAAELERARRARLEGAIGWAKMSKPSLAKTQD